MKNVWWKETLLKLDLGTTVVAAVMILEVVNNWRSVLQINILKKKLDFEPESPSVTEKVCYHYNSWVSVVYMAYVFDRNSGRKTSQIEWLFESNLRPSGYFKLSVTIARVSFNYFAAYDWNKFHIPQILLILIH